MAYDNDRPKFTGNWTCSKCGAPINELPFEPNPSRLGELTCFDCHKKSNPRRNNGGGGRGFSPRPKVQGNWTCGSCGASITELPFEPDPARIGNLKCFECHKQSRG